MDGYGNPINKIDPKTGLSIPEKTKIINGQSYIKGQESKSTDGVVGVSRSDIHILNQITNNEGVIFFKSIESSLEKNGANYVNTFLGETVRKTPYYQAVGHFIVVPRSTPVTNKKGKSESPDKMLQYIVNWITNTNYSRSAYTIPDAICICIFDYDQNGNVVLYSDDGINNIVKPCPWILDIDFFFEIMVKLMGK